MVKTHIAAHRWRRTRQVARLAFAFASASASAFTFAQTTFAQVAEYDRLMQRARAGESREVLPVLQAALKESPNDVRMQRDLVVIANWAESHELAAQTFALLTGAQPAYVLAPAALSLRRIGQWDRAIAAYGALLEIEPDNRDAQAGHVLARLGRGDTEGASTLVERYLPPMGQSRRSVVMVPLLEALANVRERQSRWTEALAAWQDILAAVPNQIAAKRAMLFVASRLGAASVAQDMAISLGNTVEPNAQRRLRQDRTAYQIRWGEIQSNLDTGGERFGWTDRAIASSTKDLADAPSGVYETNATLDRLVALRDRARMADVVALFEQSQQKRIVLTPYARVAVADALLYQRRPQEARDQYLLALRDTEAANGTPETEWQFSLIYAYVECEQWREAMELSDVLVARFNPFLFAKSAIQRNDPNYARARVTRAVLDSFADRLEPAKQRLEEILSLAPHNMSARAALASWYAANDMPRHSNEAFLRIKAEDADFLTGRMGLAESDVSLRRWTQARAQSDALFKAYPENRSVQRLQDEWTAFDAPSVSINVGASWPFDQVVKSGDGTASGRGNRELRIDAYATSMPIADANRLVAHVFSTNATFSETNARRDRYGVGFESNVERYSFAGELHQDHRVGKQVGAAASVSYTPIDEWRIRAALDTNTTDVSLKASVAGIRAAQYNIDVTRRFPLSRSVALGLNAYEFSDGNRRIAGLVNWHERWVSEPKFKLDTDTSISASNNSITDAPYFNPAADASIDLTTAAQWLTWRSYNYGFKQRLQGSLGAYWQDGFGTKPALGIRYEHEWEQARRWVVRYGVGVTRRPYDGRQEQRAQAFFELGWKLR